MRSEPPEDPDTLREKIIGLGETSLHKSYYSELQKRLLELERFRALLDQTHDAIFLIHAATGELADVNASAGMYLGYSKEELLATPFQDLIALPERARCIDTIQKGCDHSIGSHLVCVTALVSREGREIPMEVTIRFVTFGDEQYIVAIARDITDRLQAERELKIKESAIESSTDGILIVDLAGAIMYANPGFASIFGYEREEMLMGRDLGAFFVDPTTGAAVMRRLLKDRAIEGETIGLRSGGAPFHIHVSGSVVQNGAGQPLCIMLIVMDITERVITDQMKRETYTQLGKNIEQFAILGDHIRNPLQVIVGYAEMIDDPLATKILDQSNRIDEIIAQLDRGWIESASVRQFLRKHGGDAELRAPFLIQITTTQLEDP